MSSNASFVSGKSINEDDLEAFQQQRDHQQQRPVNRLFTPFLNKKVPKVPLNSERKPFPLFSANPISKIFLLWIIPLLNIGYKRTIEPNDLWYLDENLKLETVSAIFNDHLNTIILKNNGKYPILGIIKALVKTYKWEFFWVFALRIIANVILAINPLLVRYLIVCVQERQADPAIPINKGLGYVFGITLMSIIGGMMGNYSFILSKFIGGNAKTILTKSLLEKALIANSKTKHDYSNGKILSMFAGDLSRIDLGFALIPTGLSSPVSIIIAIVILIVNIGVSALVGIGLFIIVIFLTTSPAKFLIKFRVKANKFTDERISLMREILQSLKMIKFYSWEDAYERNVITIRNKEVHYLYILQAVKNIISSLSVSSPFLVSMGSFLVLYAVRKDHDTAKIFSSIGLFSLLSQTALIIPFTLSFATDALTALDRVTKYFEAPVEDYHNESFYNDELINDSKTAIKIVDGEFEWENFDQDASTSAERVFNGLKDINFEIAKGEFIVITGSIGSGKSSLLAAIGGVMSKLRGNVGINGSLLLCGDPWIQNTTVKENILFGSQFDRKRYRDVIKACAFDTDIEELPAGEITEIGERGITLSGGQKARLDLARAIYADKDIYLFDDVLSAVDANVGKHITSNCFEGILSGKTRILATHQLSLIKRADRVIFLNGDGTIDIGTDYELKSRNAKYNELLKHENSIESEQVAKKPNDHINANEAQENQRKARSGALYGQEERAINSIPLKTYKQYFDMGTNGHSFIMAIGLFSTLALSTFGYLFTNVWLSFWVDNKFPSLSNGAYIGIYVLVTVATMALIVFQYAFTGHIVVRASQNLNIQSVQKVLHTPMEFMDTTPVGRVMNRFSKDTNTLDSEIGENVKYFLYLAANSIGIIIVSIVYIPWFAIAIPFLILIYVGIANYYQATSREVKRLEAVTRSFIMNNFNEVLNGMSTIKTYKAQERFLLKNNVFSDKLNEAYFVFNVNQRWVCMAVDSISALVLFIVSLLAITRTFNISPASVGLLVSYLMTLVGIFSVVVRTYSEVENGMNSAERVCYYANSLKQEAPYRLGESTLNPNWPLGGTVEFQNVALRYRADLPHVLKRLTFQVGANEKIGICGRTGAGKSSIMVALYRLAELDEGFIKIDGFDISKLGLHTLRSKLSIIPQDSTLFKGDIRKNLDPFHEHDDEVLWDSLRRSGLISAEILEDVKTQSANEYHQFHLLSKVEDNGSNFSLGERQLLALARALVRQSKILILDEATSSVDYQTDALVQKTIATEFNDCTILCIAHRLKTILNYDKILVLEKGEVEEFDTPWTLFNKGGRFREMCESASITSADF